MNVCESLIDILTDYGVKYIFGIPGDAINELLEAIRKQDKIRFIHMMHEEAGAFAASAQAKLSGELAVCAGTAGPGAIHLLNGLYDAKMDAAPVLAITGQVDTQFMGTAYQQEVNLQALFSDVTVFNQTVVNPAQFPEMAVLACQTALAQKGVSHISIPVNISRQKVPDHKGRKQLIRSKSRIFPYQEDLLHAADLINRAKRPCILAGIGARDAVNELLLVATRIQAPIIKALRGKDLLPDEHPYTLGGIGLLGTKPSVKAMKDCDLLLVAGSDFPYTEFYPDPEVPVIQIDHSASRAGRRTAVDVPLIGDAKLVLAALLPHLTEKSASFLERGREHMQRWLKEQDKVELSNDTPVHPQVLARSISMSADESAVVVCDTGAVTVWGARNFRMKGNQRFTLSGGLASMAFGLPAAIGAQLLYPNRQVIALCGDGGFAMLMADFATAVKYSLNIKIFIFNNSKLGLIQMEQESRSGIPEFETDLWNPDYAEFARICGGEGFRVNEFEELDSAIQQALQSSGPCIVDVMVNPGELTWPPEVSASEAYHYLRAKLYESFTPSSAAVKRRVKRSQSMRIRKTQVRMGPDAWPSKRKSRAK